MPHSAVRDLIQTRDGYLWLGTLAGIVRFDGVGFRTFGRLQDPSLRSDRVRSIAEAADGSLLVGFANGGVRRFRDGGWEEEEVGSLRETIVNEVLVASDGTIWLGTDTGITTLFEGGRGASQRGQFATASVADMVEDAAGRIWLATHEGLLGVDPDTVIEFTTSNGMPVNAVTAVLSNPDGSVWAGTSGGGIASIRGDRVIDVLTTTEGLTSNNITTLYRDRRGTIWIGTGAEGLMRYADGSFSAYTSEDGLLDDRVSSFLEDVEGNLWVGTYGGLVRFTNPFLTTFGVRDGLAGNRVQSIFEAADGSVWVASLTGVARRRGGDFEIPSWVPRDGWESARAVIEDRTGALWVGTDAGLRRYSDGRWSTFTTDDGLPSLAIFALHEDAKGDLWVGTGGGLTRWTGEGFVSPPGAEAFERMVMTLFEDKTGGCGPAPRTACSRHGEGPSSAWTWAPPRTYRCDSSMKMKLAPSGWVHSPRA